MSSFEKNVFINCPFDDEYEMLLKPLIFTVAWLGFTPRIAFENTDGSVTRVAKIVQFIRESKYSIHDLSRTKSVRKNEYARLNMPFELGIDFGSKEFSKKHKDKKLLALSEKEYDSKRALSDFAGFDAQSHEKDPVKLVEIVRNWFYQNVAATIVDTGIQIWFEHQSFLFFLSEKRYKQGYRGDKQLQSIYPVQEYLRFIADWKNLRYPSPLLAP